MNIFDFTDYRRFVADRIKSMPGRGRGQFLKIANALGMHTSSISQIFKGHKNLTLEQGASLAEYLELTELEADYFLTLIEYERSGNRSLKKIIENRIKKLKEKANQLSNRLPPSKVITEDEQTRFYSDWFYSAIRLSTDIPGFQTVDDLSRKFSLSRVLVDEVLKFLVQAGLCVETSGEFKLGSKRTHLDVTSPLVSRHHTNWRLKAIEKSSRIGTDNELQFSSPMTLSNADAKKVRKELQDYIQSIVKISFDSPSEELFCLNMDWFKVP